MTKLESTVADYQTQLFSVFEHIMKYYRPWAEKRGMKSCHELKTVSNDEYVTLAASVICRQKPMTAKGFMFFTLEDETGLANVIVKPKLLKTYKDILLHHNFLAISGRIQNEDGVVNLVAQHIESLPQLIGRPKIHSRDFH